MVITGTDEQNSATLRHAVKLPQRNTQKMPEVAAIPAQAVNTPLTEGSLNKQCTN